MMWKKMAYYVLTICLILTLLPAPSLAANELNIEGEACILVDGISGQVLYSHNADKKWFPASTTKIMTLVLALEAVAEGRASLEDPVTTSEYAAGMGGSQVYLYPGETRTLHEMLIAIAVGSGNDASTAVAEYLGGSNEGFVKMMNDKAKALGMKNTNFVNSHGLHDDNHYTTAEDMAKLGVYALKVPKMLEYTSIYEYDFRPEPKPLKLWNTNRLLKWYEGCDGLKTGTTALAKRNLVSTAEKNNLRLVGVVLGVGKTNGHFTESMKLLNYGFNQFEFLEMYPAGKELITLPIGKGEVDQVGLVTANKVGIVQKKGEKANLSSKATATKYITAPIKKGDKLGELTLIRDGKEIDKIDLVANQDVGRGGLGRQITKMLRQVTLAQK
ncbi:D-alanyl-D-alanine carboxypeptidase [Dehalobacterium formicoaceticum]|uniref:serine-type D-Ala-D-Ala carboxypeptidase n=1 Tax=Dehalobacterium formicoaceticum TaxID=51515 RepID=A0ABT1Y5R3_9FIRM|nr:D-alanyl-D-alanine carboxypeptidase family protein [Dehalobacterium formicoaceticum]MCR6545821.1 D-alanyl-D-alanine carboxypeptidase [Dehalobacterium formicoaceticum]